mmetsp:Transcript_3704/g.5803  ORF Transcript_3704/g.5803 Transcript_3704/m.5803 type:complete len:194 (+) Transcript_3704:1920-2501(+)
MEKVLHNGYVKIASPGQIRSLMYMFDVPKGDSDIRMVYDGSKSGLNDCSWAPWFPLPTVETMCRTLESGYWCADNDYGEHFLNFPLSSKLQQYCGLDLSQLFPEEAGRVENMLTAVWVRNAMGLKQSPYAAVQGSPRTKTVVRSSACMGKGSKKPFGWTKLQKNYPGSQGYNSSFALVAKIDDEGLVAAELHQ